MEVSVIRSMRLRAFAALALPAFSLIVRASDLTLVTSPAGQPSPDAVSWSQLGTDSTQLSSTFSAKSAGGVTISGALSGAGSVLAVVCSATPCSWKGAGIASGTTAIWTSDLGNGGNGPLTLQFGKPVSGAGAMIQADAPGQFTAQIDAYNGTQLLGSFTESSA